MPIASTSNRREDQISTFFKATDRNCFVVIELSFDIVYPNLAGVAPFK